jgi:cell division septum initiation protein DivIVA
MTVTEQAEQVPTDGGEDRSTLAPEIGLRPLPGFELALRGYHRGQVDRFAARADARLAAIAAELALARQRTSDLAQQVDRLSANLAKCTCDATTPQSRVVGARIEEVFRLAEEEAEGLRLGAERESEQLRLAAAQLLADAEENARTATQDFEEALAVRRAKEDRVLAERQAESEQYLADARSLLHRARGLSADALNTIRGLLATVEDQHEVLAEEAESMDRAHASRQFGATVGGATEADCAEVDAVGGMTVDGIAIEVDRSIHLRRTRQR